MNTTDDLDAIRARAEAARQAVASGTTGTPPNVDGLSIHDALDIFAESAEDVPALLDEVERLRAELGRARMDRAVQADEAQRARDHLAGLGWPMNRTAPRWYRLQRARAEKAEADRDRLAATVDRVAAIVEPPHIATLENLSEVIDCARAAIEGTDS